MNLPKLFHARPRPFAKRRSILIPVAVILATAAVYTASTVIPQLLSVLLSPTGQHARLVPDNAELHVSVDLKKVGARDARTILDDLYQNGNGIIQPAFQAYTGLSEPPPAIAEWAGRELSITTFPDAGYAIIVNVRDRRAAARRLDPFIAENLQATLLTEHLVIASSPTIARAVIDRIDGRHRNSLEQTTDYQQAEHIRTNRRPLAMAFLRWSINADQYQRSYAALMGCDTSSWLAATADINADQIELQAQCPPTDGLHPPSPLTRSSLPAPAQQPDSLHYNASFEPSLEFISARTRNTGQPDFTLLDFITQLSVAPTGFRFTDIEQQALQHLDGNIQLAIEHDHTEPSPAFQITLTIRPGHRQPLAETIAGIATSMASTHGIQAAKPAPNGWLIRHPVAPNQTLSLTIKDRFLSVSNRPGHFPMAGNDIGTGNANRRRFPNGNADPTHAILRASGRYATRILAYGFPPLAYAGPTVSQIDYSLYNDGATLIHRATLTLRTSEGNDSTPQPANAPTPDPN